MRWFDMTAPEIEAVDRDATLVVQPIAAVEQHGPHLPTGVDTILVTAFSEEVERRRPGQILLCPTFWWGASGHHLSFGGTLSAELERYVDVLVDLARPILDRGFLRFAYLNGHGGNIDPMRMALRRLEAAYPGRVLAGAPYWNLMEGDLRALLDGPHKFVGHACEFETALMRALHPQSVREDLVDDAGPLLSDDLGGWFLPWDMRRRTREGRTGRPDLGSLEKGRRLAQAIHDGLEKAVDRLLTAPTVSSP